MISIFPKQKLIVHCDSAFDEDRDRLAYEAMDIFLKKALSQPESEDALQDWQYLPLSKYGLQQQNDAHSCGVFACVYAYCLIARKDIPIKEEDLSNIRYWIGKGCLEGSTYPEEKASRNTTAWDALPEVESRLSFIDDKLVNEKLGPFAMLEELLKVCGKFIPNIERDIDTSPLPSSNFNSLINKKGSKSPVYRTYQDALDDASNDSDTDIDLDIIEKSCTKESTMPNFFMSLAFVDEFMAYAERDIQSAIQSFLENYASSTQNEIALANNDLSERLTALMTLGSKTYHGLANGELLYVMCKTFWDSIWRLKNRYHLLLTRTRRSFSDCAIDLNLNQYVYQIPRTFGHTRANIIEFFFFPEHLTKFIMFKYNIDYEEATGKIYSINEPCNTVFFEALQVTSVITCTLRLTQERKSLRKHNIT